MGLACHLSQRLFHNPTVNLFKFPLQYVTIKKTFCVVWKCFDSEFPRGNQCQITSRKVQSQLTSLNTEAHFTFFYVISVELYMLFVSVTLFSSHLSHAAMALIVFHTDHSWSLLEKPAGFFSPPPPHRANKRVKTVFKSMFEHLVEWTLLIWLKASRNAL